MIGVCHLRLGDTEKARQYFLNVVNWEKAEHEEATYDEAEAYLKQMSKWPQIIIFQKCSWNNVFII